MACAKCLNLPIVDVALRMVGVSDDWNDEYRELTAYLNR
jgi:hypothetical protein